jgi:hypothetical protein
VTYTQASCAGTGVSSSGIVPTSFSATGSDGQTLSFKVQAVDELGQAGALSACKSGIKIDLTDPEPLAGFSVVAGDGLATATAGTNEVTLDFPDDAAKLADYKTVEIRRLEGGVPAADCSDGVVAKTFTSPTFPDPSTFLDFADGAGVDFGYRVCITDFAGRTESGDTSPVRTSKPQVIFATGSLQGDLGGGAGTGLDRADAICVAAAAGSGLPDLTVETRWKAVLSDSTLSARNRLGIFGLVKDWSLAGTLADDYTDFWTNALAGTIDGPGGLVPEDFALTGSTVNGLRGTTVQTCNDWTWNLPPDTPPDDYQALVGDTLGGASWLNAGAAVDCDQNYSLYCVSQPADAPAIASMTADPVAGGGITVKVKLPDDASRYAVVDLFRVGGASAPSVDCDVGFQQTLTPIANGATLQFDDASATAPNPAQYSYLVCVFDQHGNVIVRETVTGVGH